MPCPKRSLILAVLFKCFGQSPGLILFCNYYIIHMHSQVTVVLSIKVHLQFNLANFINWLQK